MEDQKKDKAINQDANRDSENPKKESRIIENQNIENQDIENQDTNKQNIKKQDKEKQEQEKQDNKKRDMEADSMKKQEDAQGAESPAAGKEAEERKDSAEDPDGAAEGDEAESGAQDEAEASADGIKKGFFKKNKKKDKKEEEIEKLTDQLKRQMAEFENFRKRTEKEKTQMYEIGAKSIIEKVLPVVDNFERGLAAVPEENREDAFVDGMNKIYKQLLTMFEEAGVEPIEAVGKEFDPNLHNAVMQVDSEEYASGVVAQELQKGYRYRDSVVRHSMVAVAN